MVVDSQLFESCGSGDPLAWRRLYRLYAHRVFRWAVLRGLRVPEAEDAAQEVLAIAWRRFSTCRAPEAFDTWLYQITRRVVANTRRRAWWRKVIPTDRPPEPAFDLPDPATEMAVRACLRALPDPQAEVLMLFDVEGYTREEVADMVGRSPGTVASRLRLGRAAFRHAWSQVPGGLPCPLPVEES